MDLKHISLYENQVECELKEEDIEKLNVGGIVCNQFLEGINTCFDISSMWDKNVMTANLCYIHNELNSGNMKILYKCSSMLSNGLYLEKSSVKSVVIPLMTLQQLRNWVCPRKIHVKIKVGFYWGTGGDEFDKNNILCDVEDFFPICSPSTNHTISMNNLLDSGNFSDVTLVCKDNTIILAHKCLLLTSPYFYALFGKYFGQQDQNIVNTEYDGDTMKILLSFIYSGILQEDKVDDWQEMYLAASFYQMECLMRHSELQLMTRVKREWNCIKGLFRFANTFNAFKLKYFLICLTRYIQQTT